MSKLAKILLSLTAVAVITVATSLSQVAEAAKPTSIACTINVVSTSHANNGTVVSTETYQQSFVVTEAVPFSDDFSTFTRFKFFDASLTKANGISTVAISWFADVSVFNAVDFSTSLKILNGQNTGEVSGTYTFSFSGGFNTTTYTLVGVRN